MNKDWLRDHLDTVVLDINTGFNRDDRPEKPYGEYFANPDTRLPVSPRHQRLAPKSFDWCAFYPQIMVDAAQ